MILTAITVCCMQLSLAATDAIEIRLPEDGAFLTPAEAEAARKRCDAEAWAGTIRDEVFAKAEALLAAPLDIPHKPGQWALWYNCADDGGELDAKSPTEHVCPICGKVYSGWPYDDVYVERQHGKWLGGIETLGLAYSLDPRPAFAERARAILLEYASFYEQLPLHDINNKQGSSRARLASQTLDEAVLLCRVARGYDAFRAAACFTAEDRDRIAAHLLRPMCATIQANDRNISNWQSWHNAAVGCTGFVLRDPALVDWAVNGKSGFLFQMDHSVLESGMWYEESPSYHWYALRAHIYLLEAAARAGMPLYALPIVKRLFDAPVRQLYPDGAFPPLQDSDRDSIREDRPYYAIAYNHYGDPAYLPLIPPRDSEWALFWGGDAPDTPPALPALTSSNSASEGLAILREAAKGVAVYLDYGAGHSGHVHPAKLNVLLFADGDERFVDPGRLPYGNPLHRSWYTQTIAHNTVTVDGKSQRRAPGELVAFTANADFSIVRARATHTYKDEVLERTLFLRGNTLVDVFHCASAEEHAYDLPLHVRGALDLPDDAADCPPLGADNGYEHLKNVKQTAADTFVVHTAPGRALRIAMHDTSEKYLAEGMGATPQEIIPLVLRRIRGKDAYFAAVYEMVDDAALATPPPPFAMQPVPGGVSITTGDATLTLDATTKVTIGGNELAIPPDAGP